MCRVTRRWSDSAHSAIAPGRPERARVAGAGAADRFGYAIGLEADVPNFRVIGLTAKRGRPTTKEIAAETPDEARRAAERLGVKVEAVERLPSVPASEAQLAYARKLGIPIPESATLEQMTYLISQAVDAPASPWLIARTRALGAEINGERFASHGYISGRLVSAIGRDTPAYYQELATWFLFSVLRHRRRASWATPADADVAFDIVHALAGSLVQDHDALKSLKRDYQTLFPEERVFVMLDFGRSTAGRLSDRTIVFKAAVELLDRAGL